MKCKCGKKAVGSFIWYENDNKNPETGEIENIEHCTPACEEHLQKAKELTCKCIDEITEY